jgi:hypothetical protein
MNASQHLRFLCAMCTVAIAVFAVTGTAAAQSQKWEFQVYLDDKPIGHHHYVLRDAAGERELKTDARFDVKVLFINAYRYVHDASERWRGNCLTALNARTDDNGERSDVAVDQQGERLAIATPRGREAADGCIMSFAYWNPEILRQSRLLNSQTGRVEAVTIAALGEEKIAVRGASAQARRYRISGLKHPIDLWYGADGAWLALQSTLDSGRRLRYQLK